MPNNPAQELASSAAPRIDASSFPFWAQQGNLREHWYPLAFENKLKNNSATRRFKLDRLKTNPAAWCELVARFGKLFSLVAGQPHRVDEFCSQVRKNAITSA